MPAPAPSWNTCRVYGTWHRLDGTRRTGSYKVTIPVRVTNSVDDVIVPAGVALTGELEIDSGSPSLDILVPSNSDPDNSPNGWQPIVEVTFTDAAGEKYVIDTPVDGEVNLRMVVLAASLPVPQTVLIRGVPGGLAELDEDGDVVDAAGDKVTAGVSTWAALPDKPTLATVATSGAYNDLAGKPTIPTTAADVSAVPTTRTVAGKPLSANVTLTAADVSAVPTTRTVAGKALTADVTLTAADVSAVPTTRTVAGKALSTNVTLAKGDVGLSSVDDTRQLPLGLGRPIIRATAANTWPTKASQGLAGYTGPWEYDHSEFGPINDAALPSDSTDDDIITDEYP